MQKEPSEKKKTKKKMGAGTIILLVIAIGVFCFAGYNLLQIGLRYKAASDSYKEVETLFVADDEEEKKVRNPDTDPYDFIPFKWDFNALLKANPESKGWIYEKDVLNYPIVQAEDNDKYLHMMFDGTYNPSGALFVDARMPKGLEGVYSIVYGHNMNDGSMFGKLLRYSDKAFYDEHPRMHVMIGEKHYVYNVVGAFTAHVEGFAYEDPLNEKSVVEFVKKVKEETPYETTDMEISKKTNILVLSTCTSNSADEYRVVVVLARDHEVVTN